MFYNRPENNPVSAAEDTHNTALKGLEKQMAKRGRPPGVKNGEGKTSKANAERKASGSSGAKRGRKPTGFIPKLGRFGDSIEAEFSGFQEFLKEGLENETRPEFQTPFVKAISLIDSSLKNLTAVIGQFADLPENYVPGFVAPVVLSWVPGALCEFRTPELAKALGEGVYDVEAIIELGRGPGNGTMVKLKGLGLFSQKQLTLVDPADVEEPAIQPVPVPVPVPVPSVLKKTNGAVDPLAALAKVDALKAIATDEDLNA